VGSCCIAVTADERHIVTGGEILQVRNAATGGVVPTLRGNQGIIFTATITSDGRHVIAGGEDDGVFVWDFASGKLRHELVGHENWVSCVAAASDGTHIVSAGSDHTLRIWERASHRCHLRCRHHAGWAPPRVWRLRFHDSYLGSCKRQTAPNDRRS
jgi:WD40 repeat protein